MVRRNNYVTPPSSGKRRRRSSTSSSGSLRSALGYGAAVAAVTGNPMTAEVLSGASYMVDMFNEAETQTSGSSKLNMHNRQAGKASSSRKGKLKLTGKKKPVKVSKELAKKVKKVIDGQDYRGTYLTDKQMYIDYKSSSNAATSGYFDQKLPNIGAYSGCVSNTFIPIGMPGRVCQWWAAGQANAVGSVPAGYDWTHFSPLKILDAASVLWNRKRRNPDYSFGGGNFTVDARIATGVPDSGSLTAPDKKNFKIHVENAYAKFQVKNITQRRIYLTFYHCTAKQKFASGTPLSIYKDAIIEELGGANLDNGGILEGKNAGESIEQQSANYILNPSMEPNALPAFTNVYSYQKVIINIGPGETHEHTVQGPKGFDLDFAKLWDGGQDKGGFMYKACTVQTMVKMELDQVFAQTTSGPFYAPVSYPSQLPTGNFQCPVAITLKENYTLRCPKISGFIKQAIVAGSTQMLNLKKRSFAALNVGSTPIIGQYAIQGVFDEEQPGTTIPTSSFI